jgi:branched-chain amino acid transport system substrate-binding protein
MKAKVFWLWFFVLLVAIPIIGLSFTACPNAASERTEILVGAINSLTGTNVMTAAEQKFAQETAVADINAKGGVFVKDLNKKLPIKLVFADDKSTAADAAAAMEKLIKLEKVDFALGTNITPLNMAAATVAEKYKVYFAVNTAMLDAWGAENYQYSSCAFFQIGPAAEVPCLIWDSRPEAERPQNPALMVMDNPDGQRSFGDGFRNAAAKYNYTIALDEPYMPDTKDFTSSIVKMKSADVDALIWLGSPTDSITMIRQIKEQQLNLKYIQGWMGFWNTEFVDALGADSDYIVHDGFWAETLPYPGCEELGEKYMAATGTDSVSVGLPYACVQVLAQAIEQAGTIDSTAVRDVVYGGQFTDTVLGDIQYDEKGLCVTPSFAFQWMDGKRMPVWPPVSDYTVQWMPPWDQR